MMNSGKLKVMTSGDRDVVITREFNAPRNLVWDCYTKPELIKRWLTGYPGWTLSICEVDVWVGGKYRWVWSNADGTDMGMGGVYLEVEKPEKIVNTQLFDQDWTGGETIVTLFLTEKNGGTLLTNTILYSSSEARDNSLKSGMTDGMGYSFDRLEETLATLA